VLTQAYKTLGDPEARAEYDARIGESAPERVVSPAFVIVNTRAAVAFAR
jgi:DnaJ-class molecular chaperone